MKNIEFTDLVYRTPAGMNRANNLQRIEEYPPEPASKENAETRSLFDVLDGSISNDTYPEIHALRLSQLADLDLDIGDPDTMSRQERDDTYRKLNQNLRLRFRNAGKSRRDAKWDAEEGAQFLIFGITDPRDLLDNRDLFPATGSIAYKLAYLPANARALVRHGREVAVQSVKNRVLLPLANKLREKAPERIVSFVDQQTEVAAARMRNRRRLEKKAIVQTAFTTALLGVGTLLYVLATKNALSSAQDVFQLIAHGVASAKS